MNRVVGRKHYKQYVLKQVLGTGSFGKVYYSPPFAIKEMNYEGMPVYIVNALKNQITLLKKINHPNVVKLVDFFYEGTCVYLVMQYCEQDLSAFLKKRRCDQRTALGIFRQLVSGFKQLVNQGIIHRDLKPANILANSKGQFKLADFGFAKFVDQYENKLLNSIVGTPMYMSPQILSKSQYTTKSDIWSLGLILYQMLTGACPWTGSSEAQLYKNILSKPFQIPPYLSASTQQLLLRMLKINEKDRISWEELFNLVLIRQNYISDKPRPQTSRQLKTQIVQVNSNKCTPRKKLFPQTPERGEQKLKTEQKDRVNSYFISPQIIKQLFFIQLERMHGQDLSRQIVLRQIDQVCKYKIERTLQNFNEQFQKSARSMLKNLYMAK